MPRTEDRPLGDSSPEPTGWVHPNSRKKWDLGGGQQLRLRPKAPGVQGLLRCQEDYKLRAVQEPSLHGGLCPEWQPFIPCFLGGGGGAEALPMKAWVWEPPPWETQMF